MIGIAIAYWLIINTIGVSTIVASMCKPNEKPKTETKKDKYPANYFEDLKETKEQECMEKLLDKISSSYKSSVGVAINFVLSPDTYKRITYKTLYDTFVLKYGFCMCTASGGDFTHADYLNEYPMYLFQER